MRLDEKATSTGEGVRLNRRSSLHSATLSRPSGAILRSLPMSMPTVRVSVLSSVAAIAVSVTAFAITAPASVCAAALAPLASRDLDFTPSALRLFKDPESGKHYWYMTYDVVNNTGQDQRFAPRIEMLTDEGHVVRQGDGVPGSVSKQIMKYLGNELLEDQFEILGEVLQGKEHAKSGLVVFAVVDLDAIDKKVAPRVHDDQNLDHTELSIFVQGLSRETKKVEHPKSGEPVTQRKAWRIDYLVPGNPQTAGTVSYPVESQGWTFR